MIKSKVNYILLGFGLGIIFTSMLNIAFNRSKYIEYTEQEIREKARALGMVSLRESIEANSNDREEKEDYQTSDEDDDEEEENKEDKEDDEVVNINQSSLYEQNNSQNNTKNNISKPKPTQVITQSKQQPKNTIELEAKEGYAVIRIVKGDSAIVIAKKLKEVGIIENEREFIDFVRENKLQYSFITGDYQIKINQSYEEILKRLLREEEYKKLSTE